MNQLALNIIQSQKVSTESGEEIPLNSSIDLEEANFLYKLITDNQCIRTLEIGCAMGISSLVICEAISKNDSNTHHLIVDPFQMTDWNGLGIKNLKKSNFTNFTLYEDYSEFILPKLVKDGIEIDFAFIDGWHTFDHTIIDFFFLNRMLKEGGIIVIDDVGMPAINKVLRYILNYPAYEHLNSVIVKQSNARKNLEIFKSIFRPFSKILGQRIAFEFLSSTLILGDASLGLNASMVALRKIAHDERSWNWYKDF